jgi:hypothetical protein
MNIEVDRRRNKHTRFANVRCVIGVDGKQFFAYWNEPKRWYWFDREDIMWRSFTSLKVAVMAYRLKS